MTHYVFYRKKETRILKRFYYFLVKDTSFDIFYYRPHPKVGTYHPADGMGGGTCLLVEGVPTFQQMGGTYLTADWGGTYLGHGSPPPICQGRYPSIGQGRYPPQPGLVLPSPIRSVLATPRGVCLLRLRWRTFFFIVAMAQSRDRKIFALGLLGRV